MINETRRKRDCEFHLSNFNRILSLVMNSPRQKRNVLCGNICGSRPFANTSCATRTFQNNKEIQNPCFLSITRLA